MAKLSGSRGTRAWKESSVGASLAKGITVWSTVETSVSRSADVAKVCIRRMVLGEGWGRFAERV